MPGREFGPDYYGPGHMWVGLIFMGLSLLFWLGIPALLAWAALRWVAPRWRGMGGMSAMSAAMTQPAQPSPIETLRHRYALGEIDSTTFEQMVERILASEARERQASSPSGPSTPISTTPDVSPGLAWRAHGERDSGSSATVNARTCR